MPKDTFVMDTLLLSASIKLGCGELGSENHSQIASLGIALTGGARGFRHRAFDLEAQRSCRKSLRPWVDRQNPREPSLSASL